MKLESAPVVPTIERSAEVLKQISSSNTEIVPENSESRTFTLTGLLKIDVEHRLLVANTLNHVVDVRFPVL